MAGNYVLIKRATKYRASLCIQYFRSDSRKDAARRAFLNNIVIFIPRSPHLYNIVVPKV
jgi:hypothetical protein